MKPKDKIKHWTDRDLYMNPDESKRIKNHEGKASVGEIKLSKIESPSPEKLLMKSLMIKEAKASVALDKDETRETINPLENHAGDKGIKRIADGQTPMHKNSVQEDITADKSPSPEIIEEIVEEIINDDKNYKILLDNSLTFSQEKINLIIESVIKLAYEKGYEKGQTFRMGGMKSIRDFREGYEKAIDEFKKLIDEISKYKSEINNFVNIGRQNCINDIENEIEKLKEDLK